MNPLIFFGSAALAGIAVCSLIPTIERVRVKYLLPWLDGAIRWGRSRL
jgi:hypothetical protein